MIRELIEITWLEDFVSGLARSSGCRICVYDVHGELIVASAGNNSFARLTGHAMGNLPGDMTMIPVPAHDPPARGEFRAVAWGLVHRRAGVR